MTRAIIFDIDGTLLDSVDLHARAWVDAFALYGHDLPFEKVREQIGKGGDQLMPVFLTESEIARVGEKLEADRGALFKQRYLAKVRPFADVRALMQRLRAGGKLLALASSAKHNEVEVYKKIAQIDDLIEADTSADDADRSKPNPDIFVAALQRLHGVPPEDALAVGDTPYDAIAAAKAGIRTIGVTCGGWSAAALEDAGCVAVYADPADLLANIDRWGR
ncbi:MAG: HAD family hydrolase [Reyranellales bacterium]|jgi:HAD superfamily hydrolase (TIGR01509 family)